MLFIFQVDLDRLFNFLSGEIVDSSLPSESSFQSGSGNSDSADKSSIFDEIDRQMSDLQNEIDRYGKQQTRQKENPTNENYESSGDETPPPPPEFTREVSPRHYPSVHDDGNNAPTSNSTYMLLTKPSLPEPEGPPPPPPVQNGYAFNTPHMPPEVRNPLGNLTGKNTSETGSGNTGSNGIMKKPKEPIYESIKPRPEPLGGPAEDESGMEYGFTMPQQQQLRPANGRQPLPQVPVRNSNGIYGKLRWNLNGKREG